MHIFFSGISGAGIGPLALIAKQAGYEVSGSDKQTSSYLSYLHDKGICDITVGQTEEDISLLHSKKPIDWLVYSSAVPKENPQHPELLFAEKQGIKASKRDEFLNHLLQETNKQMIAVAGTHGKTTTTAMIIWLFKEFGIPVSYSVGAKIPFGQMGEYDPASTYFVYEADEYDRNFLSFSPEMSVISGIDYDHPDIYPTREIYYEAFVEFLKNSEMMVMHAEDAEKLGMEARPLQTEISDYILPGQVNRKNAQIAVQAFQELSNVAVERIIEVMNRFPGVSRRFETISEGVISDYAHTPEKIRGALQTAKEMYGSRVIVVYEGLHNTRQHFIKDELKHLFTGVKKLYVVPSYLAREDKDLELLTPEKLCSIIEEPTDRVSSAINDVLKQHITSHVQDGDIVLCLTAGGGGSLDEWLRKEFVR